MTDSRKKLRDKKPTILVSVSARVAANGQRELYCYQSYVDAVAQAGGIPVLAPEHAANELADLFDGLLLSGGDDLDPALFGETVLNDTVVVDRERDQYELSLARAFVERGKPILGICRGAQVLNVLFGGDIYQDLAEQKGLDHKSPGLEHGVTLSAESRLSGRLPAEMTVNTFHHQALRRIAEGFAVTATASDGVVEMIEHRTLPILGTQFHPERMVGAYRPESQQDFAVLFADFIQTVKRYAAE